MFDDVNTLPLHRAVLNQRVYGLPEVVKALVEYGPNTVKVRSGYFKDESGAICDIRRNTVVSKTGMNVTDGLHFLSIFDYFLFLLCLKLR